MTHCCALGTGHQFDEEFAFFLHAIGIVQSRRCLDRLNASFRRMHTAYPACVLGAKFVEQAGILHSILLGGSFRTAFHWLADLRAGKGDGIRLQTVFSHDLVEQSDFQCLLGCNRITLNNHRQGVLHADDARQALCSGGAWDQPQLDFGQSHLRTRHSNAVMACKSDFTSTAEGSSMDRSYHRLVTCLHLVESFRKVRADRRLAEFGDVGTRKKSPSITAYDYCFDAVIGQSLFDPVFQPLAHLMAQRIDRRIVGDDYQDIIVTFGTNWRSHRGTP